MLTDGDKVIMQKKTHIFGIIGIVFVVFGLITTGLLVEDNYHIIPIHFILGLIFILAFILQGGSKSLKSAAAKRTAGFSISVLIYTALFLGVVGVANYFVNKHDFLHFDSTEQKVFTLASQTRDILENLPNPVIIRAFYLGGAVNPDVEDLLNRLAKASDKLSWKKIDPEKQPQLTEKLGVSEAETIHISYDIKGVTRESKVVRDITEESIINAILKVTRGGPKNVYYISGHNESDLESDTQAGFLFLKEAIQGENLVVNKLLLEPGSNIPEDCSALLLLAPKKELLPFEKEAINKYLAAAGNALFLNEPNSTSDIAEFSSLVGIAVGKDMIVDQVLQLFAGPSMGVQPMVSTYVKHPITEKFRERTIYSTASSVSKSTNLPANREVTELAFTSDTSWAETNLKLLLGEEPQAALEKEDIKGPVPIATASEITTAKNLEPSSDSAGETKHHDSKGRVVVFGDADFVANINIRQLYNRDFFLNALNWVVGEQEHLSIRAGSLRKSLTVLTPEQIGNIFLFTAILIPELILILGLFVWWLRKKQ
jgi:ABC-type uncharacterized transport system involved in gliding motility auxiliary subunit